MTRTDEDLELDDLDLLDDPHKHVKCILCTTTPPGVPFIARCGRRAVGLTGIEVKLHQVPPGVSICPDCLVLIEQPCSKCGSKL